MNLQISQYNCIGLVAQHCDTRKICIAENEASDFDLAELFCDFWADIEGFAQEVRTYDDAQEPKPVQPTNYKEKKELLEGGVYLDCQQKQRPFGGVYDILVRYSYSRYIILNGFNDTSTGFKEKTNDFSIPKTIKELEQFSNKYRDMAKISYERTVRYICQNNDIFNYNHCPVDKCGCGSDKCGYTKSKGYGFKSKNVNK